MDDWNVDADGVLALLTSIDTVGPDFERAHRDITDAAESGAALAAGGRTVVKTAWTTFIEDRSLVPGKIMHEVAAAASAVSEATAALVAGDEQMSLDTTAAQSRAESWGIAPTEAYSSSAGEN
ncbi:DUF6507 family protein [Microbacterium sp. NPDC008134]|jgi:hypothetical protein|uniref:DUF6507 family protein n=1 Tax=Microbacterium sp. NPDC008134 TaxID=3364183 RepID=UPI0036EAAAFD